MERACVRACVRAWAGGGGLSTHHCRVLFADRVLPLPRPLVRPNAAANAAAAAVHRGAPSGIPLPRGVPLPRAIIACPPIGVDPPSRRQTRLTGACAVASDLRHHRAGVAVPDPGMHRAALRRPPPVGRVRRPPPVGLVTPASAERIAAMRQRRMEPAAPTGTQRRADASRRRRCCGLQRARAAQADNLKRTWLQNVTHYYFYGLTPPPSPCPLLAAPSPVGRSGRTALGAPRDGLSPYVG